MPVLGQVFGPFFIFVLCAVAGVGTYLLLPSRREGATRKIGGAVLLLALLVLGATLFRYAYGDSRTDEPRVSAYFWIFAAIAVIGAIRVITHPRPVYSALYFVMTVFATAGLFVLLAAEFMAAALVLIYAGAILVTYVFVIMLAQQSQSSDENRPLAGLAEYDVLSREPLLASLAGLVLMGVLLFVIFDHVQPLAAAPEASAPGARGLGESLFGANLVSTETAGVILTLAMVGAIAIARRRIGAALPATEAGAGPRRESAISGDDNPHAIPVYGTENPRQKAYPET